MNTSFVPQGATWIRVEINGSDVAGIKLGQPALFIEPAGVLFEQPTLFLHRHFVQSGKRPSPKTWEAAAYALQSWFEFIWETGTPDWQNADREKLISYRDAYTDAISPKTGLKYASNTVASRMGVVLSFYEFAAQIGLYDGDLVHINTEEVSSNFPINRDQLAHTGKGIKVRTVSGLQPKTRVSRSAIRPFSESELRKTLNAAGPRASERDAKESRSSRSRLMIDLGWVGGLRLDEVYKLHKHQFLNLFPDLGAPLAEQIIHVVGKGNILRPIALPNWLVQDAILYIKGERQSAITVGGHKGRKEPKSLLVAELNSNKPGSPISQRRMQQELASICVAGGVSHIVQRTNPETGENLTTSKAAHCFHDLRHTYAVMTYHAEVRSGNPEPWKKIQAQLGHKYLATTLDVYLGFVSILGDRTSALDLRKILSL